jgi:hypothetical protein
MVGVGAEATMEEVSQSGEMDKDTNVREKEGFRDIYVVDITVIHASLLLF